MFNIHMSWWIWRNETGYQIGNFKKNVKLKRKIFFWIILTLGLNICKQKTKKVLYYCIAVLLKETHFCRICSNAGNCTCRKCDCFEGFSGEMCECNDLNCPSFNGKLCGGQCLESYVCIWDPTSVWFPTNLFILIWNYHRSNHLFIK